MKVSEIYSKTFRFTLMRILTGIVSFLLIVGLPILAIVIMAKKEAGTMLIAGGIAFIFAIILVSLLSRYVGYLFRAGQIAMVAEAAATGTLPEDPYTAGKQAVKNRFVTVTVFFAIERIINAIVNQITNAVTKVTDKVGGDNKTAQSIGAAINLFISALLKYMCACVMGWVFVHPGENPWRSACNGAIVYFKNWKELLKNAGRVIGLTLVSLIIIGGPIFAFFHFVIGDMPFMAGLTEAVAAAAVELDLTLSAVECGLIMEGVAALILWGMIHGAFVDPYIMISVMTNYMKAGLENPPAREMDEKLCGLSKSYRKALQKSAAL